MFEFSEQKSIQSFLHQSQPDVGCADPVLEDFAGVEGVGVGAALQHRHVHLSVLDGQHLGELGRAYDLKFRKSFIKTACKS